MTRVVVTLMEADAKACVEAARDVDADLFEVRLDAWAKVDEAGIALVRRALGKPLIATCRAKSEGGRWNGSEQERARWLSAAVAAGFEFVDVERAAFGQTWFRDLAAGSALVASRHVHDRLPPRLEVEPSAGVAKSVWDVQTWDQTLDVMVAARRATRESLRHATMAFAQPATRFLAPLLGCEFVYAAARPGKEAAPGQVPVADLRARWSFWGLPEKAPLKTAFVIGTPLAHSLSPAMHNAGYRTYGLDAAYAALEPPSQREAFESTLRALPGLDALGANVTIPFKGWAAEAVDAKDEVAERTGAVNTVVVRDGALDGHNTDVEGIREALKAAGARLHEVDALVLGTGGAARAALDALGQDHARVTVAARRPEAVKDLERLADVRIVPWEHRFDAAPSSEVVVNCTPMGLHGAEDPLAGVRWTSPQTVLDLVYDPATTPLLAAARAGGARVVSGLEVLLRQGAEAFRLMTRRVPPLEAMRRALAERAGAWPVGPTGSSPSAPIARPGGEGR